VFAIEPGKSRTLHLVTQEGLQRTLKLAAITADDLDELVDLDSLSASERNLLRGALPAAQQVDTIVAQQGALLEEVESVQQDVKRLREHLATLAKSEAGAAQQHLVARLLERDEQLRIHQAKRRALSAELSRKREALAQALRTLQAS
jgi:hypothetical protein